MKRRDGLEAPFILGAALLVQAAFGLAFIAKTRFIVDGATYFTLFDDAMISMRYAKNLAEGAGLVWNPGGTAVEGYTNFLWTLWMALLHWVRIPESKISLAVMVSGLALLMINAVVVWRLARRLAPEAVGPAAVAVGAVVLCYPLNYWTLRGMEVGLMALCINLSVFDALEQSDRPWSRGPLLRWICLAALPLIRPDGILPAMIVAAHLSWTRFRRGHRAASVAILIWPLAVFLGHTLVRWSVYRDVLPNTYYLKVLGVALGERVTRGLVSLGDVVVSSLWVVLILMAAARLNERTRLLFTIVLAQAAYSVWVGGDAWEWMGYANRYITVVLPLAIVLAALGVERLSSDGDSRWGACVRSTLGLLLIATAVYTLAAPDNRPDVSALGVVSLMLAGVRILAGVYCLIGAPLRLPHDWGRALVPAFGLMLLLLSLSATWMREWLTNNAAYVADDGAMARLGLELREGTSPDASIAVVWAGAIPYFASRDAVDLLGKSDRYVARLPARRPFVPGHNKWDYAYSIGTKRPDLIVQLWHETAKDVDLVQSLSYEQIGDHTFIRRDTDRVDRRRVTEAIRVFDSAFRGPETSANGPVSGARIDR